MSLFTNLSLRNKVILVALFCSAAASLMTAIALSICQVGTLRLATVAPVRAQVRLIGAQAAKALQAHDARQAQQILQQLRDDVSIEFASLYDEAGEQLARYASKELPDPLFVDMRGASGYEFSGQHLYCYERIYFRNRPVGTVFVRASVGGLQRQFGQFALLTLFVLTTSWLVASFIALLLQRIISQPIAELCSTARRIITTGDYSIRVDSQSLDEIGVLHRSFNQMLDELQTARKAIETSATTISQEIRTPLNAILGFTKLLLRGADKGDARKRREYLETIQTSSNHLLELITEILVLAKIETGQLRVVRERCAPQAILASVLSELQTVAAEKQLKLELEWLSKIPESIDTDSNRLRQVVLQLVGNAVKCTTHGEVRVIAELKESLEFSHLVIQVRDTGPGIPPERLEAIFAIPVTQLSRTSPSTGRGLAISRQIAHALGGQLQATSTLGEGTTFTLSIDAGDPVSATQSQSTERDLHERPQSQEERAAALAGHRVLAVDDGSSNLKLIAVTLQNAGLQVVTAENGREALDLASRQDFDLILMDLQMPVMDGYTATRRLREIGLSIPILALTATTEEGVQQACLEAGCSGYLAKPIDGDRLLRAIEVALAGRENRDLFLTC